MRLHFRPKRQFVPLLLVSSGFAMAVVVSELAGALDPVAAGCDPEAAAAPAPAVPPAGVGEVWLAPQHASAGCWPRNPPARAAGRAAAARANDCRLGAARDSKPGKPDSPLGGTMAGKRAACSAPAAAARGEAANPALANACMKAISVEPLPRPGAVAGAASSDGSATPMEPCRPAGARQSGGPPQPLRQSGGAPTGPVGLGEREERALTRA